MRNAIATFVRQLFVALLITLVASTSVHAQQNQPLQQQPVQQQQQQGPASNVQITRSYTFDAILFCLLAGGALYVVCRSSQRR